MQAFDIFKEQCTNGFYTFCLESQKKILYFLYSSLFFIEYTSSILNLSEYTPRVSHKHHLWTRPSSSPLSSLGCSRSSPLACSPYCQSYSQDPSPRNRSGIPMSWRSHSHSQSSSSRYFWKLRRHLSISLRHSGRGFLGVSSSLSDSSTSSHMHGHGSVVGSDSASRMYRWIRRKTSEILSSELSRRVRHLGQYSRRVLRRMHFSSPQYSQCLSLRVSAILSSMHSDSHLCLLWLLSEVAPSLFDFGESRVRTDGSSDHLGSYSSSSVSRLSHDSIKKSKHGYSTGSMWALGSSHSSIRWIQILSHLNLALTSVHIIQTYGTLHE